MSTLSPDDDAIAPPSPGQSLLQQPANHHRQDGKDQRLRLRLIVLTSVAFLALTAIAAISQQLFNRHFGGPVSYGSGRVANGSSLLLTQNTTRRPLRRTMLRHINRTKGVTAPPVDGENYDYDAPPPEDIVWELDDSLVDTKGYWSAVVENFLHRTDPLAKSVDGQVRALWEQSIVHLEPGSEQRCTSPENGFLVLQDGAAGCAHYREPHQQLVLGEVLSYHLARLLGMRNVLPAVLSQVPSYLYDQ